MTEITDYHPANALQIVHTVPGRVRLRATDSSQAINLEKVAKKLRLQEGVIEVRTNTASNSLVAIFDTNKLSSSGISAILQKYGVSQTSGLEKPQENIDPLQTVTSGEFLKEYPRLGRLLLPAIAGMLVTGALGVQGFAALPVFMITDRVVAEILKKFESESLLSNPEEIFQEAIAELKAELAADNGNGKNGNGKHENSKVEKQPQEVTCTLVHAIPGRMRFRVPRITQDPDYVKRLSRVTETDAKVKEVKINSAAGSIAISYEAGGMSEEGIKSHLLSLIQLANNPNIAIKLTENSEEESNPWSNLTLPAITAALALLSGPLGVPIPPAIVGGTIAITALPVAQRALESIITEKRLNIDFLDFAAIAITTFQGQFINPAIMLVLIELGEAIREQTARSSKKQTLDLLDSLKQTVWVERNGEKQEIPTKEVKKGDIVIVYPGDQIPVDGRIVRGKALIDEQKLTGESMPVMKIEGQTVYTSTLVREGQLYILAEQVGNETRAGQIIKVMQEAPVHDTRVENYAAKIADSAVVPTLLLSGVVFGLTGNLGRAASILTIDFATGIRVSVPTTVLAALTYAARRGIHIRSGRALEKLASVDAVVFDKTGTLTQGEPKVVYVETAIDSTSKMRVLELAAAAEQRLTHPVAAAVVRYAEEQGARVLPRGEWNYEIGLGVRAEIDGENVLVGSHRFLEKEGINLDKLHEEHPHLRSGSCSTIYVASNGILLGALAYRDPLRQESRDVIKALRTARGMEIHMLTGDNKRTATAVANELGIAPTHTHAEAFPERKVAVVKALHDEGKTVAFVGDGINDSPALAYADVSVSFGEGSDVARETADVVLMENNLQGLPEAIAIARQAMEVIHQNTAIVAVPNFSALVLAVLFGIPPLAATLVNNGSAIVAGLNGLRPLLTSSEELNRMATNLNTNEQPTIEVVSEELAPEPLPSNSVTKPNEVESLNGKAHHPLEIVVDNSTSLNGKVAKPNEVESRNGKSHHPIEIVADNSTSVNGKVAKVNEVESRNGKSHHPIEIVADNSTSVNGKSAKQNEVESLNGKAHHPLEIIADNSTSVNGKSAKATKNGRVAIPLVEEQNEQLTGRALARRLNVSSSTIAKRKSQPNFSDWTRTKDPQGIAWKYSAKSQVFVGV